MLLQQIFCQTETLARPGRLEVRSRLRLGRSSRLERLIPVSPLSSFLGFVQSTGFKVDFSGIGSTCASIGVDLVVKLVRLFKRPSTI
jgi:hypothetical protein